MIGDDNSDLDRLRDDLAAAGYDTDGVDTVLGLSASRALGRSERVPADRATRDGSPLSTLIRLFLLGFDEPETSVGKAFPRLSIERAVGSGLLSRTDNGLRAELDVRPHSDGETEFLVVSDLDTDVRPGRLAHDFVLGIGTASLTLAAAVIRDEVGSALDLGTGCGIQALHCADHAGSVVATDTNARALRLANATARLSGQTWDLRRGSLFEPVADERFDLIVSNPPFVIGTGEQHYEYRDSGFAGDGICETLVRQIPTHLNPGGTAQLLANWSVHDGADWRDRVGRWVSTTGCDAWVVQRELADPAEYVALWLKDAGETGPDADRVAERWLDYFAAEHVAGIGMGLITLRASGSDDPDVILDEITGAGEEVTGPEAAGFLERRSWLRGADDRELLSAAFRLHPQAVLEQRSIVGQDGWNPVLRMLRRASGPGATLQLDEWGQSLLAGCTGALPMIVLLQLLAEAHQVELGALAEAVLPAVRAGVTRGLLLPPGIDR